MGDGHAGKGLITASVTFLLYGGVIVGIYLLIKQDMGEVVGFENDMYRLHLLKYMWFD